MLPAFRRALPIGGVMQPRQRGICKSIATTGKIPSSGSRIGLRGPVSCFDQQRHHHSFESNMSLGLTHAFQSDTKQQRSFRSTTTGYSSEQHDEPAEPAAAEPSALQTLKDLAYKLRHPDEIKDHRSFQAHSSMRALAGRFAMLYKQLPLIQLKINFVDCPRRQVLEFLSVHCTTLTDPRKLLKAVDHLQHEHDQHHGVVAAADSATAASPLLETSAYSRLHDKSAPVYEDILRCMLQHHAVQGMQCLVAMREDLRQWIPCLHATDENLADLAQHLKRFDSHIQRQILSIWFVPGLLEIRRITYQHTSAQIIEQIARYETVHPISNLNDLRRRLGPQRRVFALFHPTLPDEPLFVLYISLQDEVATSMEQIHRQEDVLMLQTNDSSAAAASVCNPKVAVFYSISNLRPGLSGLGLAEYLIQQAVTLLKDDLSTSSLQTFVTLSPLPGFRKWLEERFIHRNQLPAAKDLPAATIAATSSEELHALADYLDCPAEFNQVLKCALTKFVERDKNRKEATAAAGNQNNKPDEVLLTNLRPILMPLAVHYLVNEKHRRKPLNKVARFHISNGAILDRVHWAADIDSMNGWRNSFGIMVTYRYDLSQVQENQARHERDNHIPLGDQVQSLLD
jgi:malonyl-CoA decarboxylase